MIAPIAIRLGRSAILDLLLFWAVLRVEGRVVVSQRPVSPKLDSEPVLELVGALSRTLPHLDQPALALQLAQPLEAL